MKYYVEWAGETHEVEIHASAGGTRVVVDGVEHPADVATVDGGELLNLIVDGASETLPETAGPEAWRGHTAVRQLSAGVDQIVLAGPSGVNVDYLWISPVAGNGAVGAPIDVGVSLRAGDPVLRSVLAHDVDIGIGRHTVVQPAKDRGRFVALPRHHQVAHQHAPFGQPTPV